MSLINDDNTTDVSQQSFPDIEMVSHSPMSKTPCVAPTDDSETEEQDNSDANQNLVPFDPWKNIDRSKIEVIVMQPTHSQTIASKPPERDDETEQKIQRGELVVTDKTPTGKIINAMFKKQEMLKKGAVPNESLKPWFRGNCLCFFYVNNEPLFTIGPDYKCSIFELCLSNTVMILVMYGQHNVPMLFYISLLVLILKNITFIMTCCLNPGMIARDPNVHNREYLLHIAKFDQMDYICKKCNLVKPYTCSQMKKKGRRTVQVDPPKLHHCKICDVCVLGHDHHCMWSGKCIAKKNLPWFYAFLGCLSALLVMFWVNLIIGQMKFK